MDPEDTNNQDIDPDPNSDDNMHLMTIGGPNDFRTQRDFRTQKEWKKTHDLLEQIRLVVILIGAKQLFDLGLYLEWWGPFN
tara:strand:+ start:224 stop:466 length:243 start_codon:yes stop_codon:yes gene_type:complete